MKKHLLSRTLKCPNHSFFLFGPRGTGKSTWLKQVLPAAERLDLLDAELYLGLSREPRQLEAMLADLAEGSWVVLDEIQKVPSLLEEVHRLMQERELKYALCGSSARRLRRGGADLLAGRALTLNMESFTTAELGSSFDFAHAIEWGTLPFVYEDPSLAPDILASYVNTYVKEEVGAEGLVRNVPPFLRFLAIAGLLNGQTVNGHNVSREAAVARATVDTYFSILVDTLLGHFLPPWRPRLKVREAAHPKFYWFDPGVARAVAGLLRDPLDRSWKGIALETLVYHELRVYNETSGKQRPVRYYRTPAGVEVDFVIETAKKQSRTPPHVVAIEVKLASKWDRAWEKPLRSLASLDGVVADKLIGVYAGARRLRFDQFDVYPVAEFLKALHGGNVF